MNLPSDDAGRTVANYGTDGARSYSAPRRLRDLLPSRFPILAYDARAADWHATLRVPDAAAGTGRPFADGQIAAIAATNSLTLISRNVADFSGIEDIALDDWHPTDHSDPA